MKREPRSKTHWVKATMRTLVKTDKPTGWETFAASNMWHAKGYGQLLKFFPHTCQFFNVIFKNFVKWSKISENLHTSVLLLVDFKYFIRNSFAPRIFSDFSYFRYCKRPLLDDIRAVANISLGTCKCQ